MSTSAQVTLVKPVPRRASAAIASRSGPPQGQKQLIARCGSASAPDPFATRTTRPPRSSTSKLTIVRLPQSQVTEEAFDARGKKHRRSKTIGHASRQRTASPSRISFASATFSSPTSRVESASGPSPEPANPSQLPFSPAPLSSSGRPQAPSITRRHAKTFSAAPQRSKKVQSFTPELFGRLTPAQVYNLAKTSTNVYPTGYTQAPLFRQIPEDVFLPFLDRPSEVLELLSNPANSKLIVLFARILRTSGEDYYPRTSAELAATVGSWTFEDLTTWLTQVSREEIDDEDWVRTLRLFVLPKSETLWEQLKGMLGVPPELDVEIGDEDEVDQPSMRKAFEVDIVPVHPTRYSSGLKLDDISEIAEAHTTNLAKEAIGLRISTSPFIPPMLSSSKRNARTVPSTPRTRTPVHGYTPFVSSPLVPRTIAQSRPRSAPPQKSLAPSGLASLLSRIRSKESACPMFPSSFDKVGIQPTLLHIA